MLSFRFFPYCIGLCLLSLFSCETDFDRYSTDKNHLLSFSTDTLSIDTILSTVGTKTYQFMVYNRNNQRLLISSIELQGGANSDFRINVDGMKGYQFKNVEIDKNDSIYIKVEATASHNEESKPVLLRDYVKFITNSVQQQVVLEAYGQDVIIMRGSIIESDSTLSNQKPYLVYDSLYVKEGATLHIQQGTTFYFYNRAELIVAGTLQVSGALQQPVIFRGDRLDINVNVPYDKIPGQWGGIRFKSSSYNNKIEYACIRNGLYGIDFERSETEQLKLFISNSVVTNSFHTLISAVNCRIEGENCEFSNAGGGLMRLTGGEYSFIHCTLANYFTWGGTSGNTVSLSNTWYDPVTNDTIPLPVSKADFLNSILYGNYFAAGVAIYKNSGKYAETPLQYFFNSCVLRAGDTKDNYQIIRENNGENIINCLFDKDPAFANPGTKYDKNNPFGYDFRLDSISPARNIADIDIANHLPYDMNGISRFLDEGPDVGAYEWISRK